MISRYIDCILHFSDLQSEFTEGDAIAVRIVKYMSKQGERYKVLTSSKTTKPIPISLVKPFRENLREQNGMGFTNSGIFIPPPMLSKHNIKDNDSVSGLAILNFNKKRAEWGWKALSINKID